MFNDASCNQNENGEHHQYRRHRKRGHVLELVKKDFHMERERVRLSTQVARNHRHRSEFAHGARRTKHHAVKERPLDMRESDAPENREALRTHERRGLFLVGSLGFQHRNQFAGNERERHENRRKHNSRHREHDLDVPILQQRENRALAAEREQENQARNNRRNRHRQVDERRENLFPLKLELREAPCGTQPEYRIDGDREERRLQRKEDRLDGVIVGNRLAVHRKTLLERFGNHRNQREDKHQEDEK